MYQEGTGYGSHLAPEIWLTWLVEPILLKKMVITIVPFSGRLEYSTVDLIYSEKLPPVTCKKQRLPTVIVLFRNSSEKSTAV